MSRYRYLLALLGVVAASIMVATAPAQAATLTQISSFGSNPGNLAMFSYRPDGLPSGRPAVVLLHGCTQDAATYFADSGWRKYADLYGFQLVLPQTSTANNSLKCFTWFDDADINRDQGEALSIRNMVGYAVANLGASSSQIYVSGLSAGGAMAAVMLATYPDVFAAGSIAAGLPYKCATSSSGTSACQYSGVDKTPQQWGDLVRAQHAGPYPRVAIWQGQSDTTVVPRNGVELVDQWTNVRGVSQTPTSTTALTGGTTLKTYGNDDVRLYEIANMGHGLPIHPGSATDQCGTSAAYFLDFICSAYYDSVFFGLTTGVTPSPSPSPSPSPTGMCVTASNYAHTQAGRAHVSFGYTYANGSNQNMGLWNVATITTLRQTGPNYWVIGC